MNNIIKKIKLKRPELEQNSLNNYVLIMKKITDYLNFKKFNIKYFKDSDTIIDFLKNKEDFSLPTKKNYITAILVVTKAVDFDEKIINEYSKYHNELSLKINDFYYDNVKNKKEIENWISRDEINKKIKKLHEIYKKSKNIWDYQDYLILNLYNLLPPLRNDFAGEMLLKEKSETKDSNCNKIIISESKLYLCDYKTKKSYGNKIIDIPEELNEIIKEFYKIREKNLDSQSKYLLLKKTKPSDFMPKNLLTKTLNRIFSPKKISTTILRKVYLSEKYPVINTYREMKNDADIMGHDINTAKMFYSKKLI